MQKTNRFYFLMTVLLAMVLAGGAGIQLGEMRGLKKAEAIIASFGYDVTTPTSTKGVSMAFMPEYGLEPLGSTELASDTTYRVRMKIPNGYWNAKGWVEGAIHHYANEIEVEFFYPEQVKKGQSAKITVLATFNGGETLTGVLPFTALEDLRLINGGSSLSYSSSGGDIDFEKGELKIRFYTGATDEFSHPDSTGYSGEDLVHCDFHAF